MPSPQRKKNSPWNAGPACDTPNALRKWDWKNSNKHIEAINQVRAAKGLPLIRSKRPEGV